MGAQASSSSKTPISQGSLPEAVIRGRRDEMMPLVKFAPESFVTVLSPREERAWAIKRAVVVFPLVPQTIIVPKGSWLKAEDRNPASIFSTIIPGKECPLFRILHAPCTLFPTATLRGELVFFNLHLLHPILVEN